MKIIFARHGETVFGAEGRFEGVSNSSLTDRGKAQARKLGQFCRKECVGKIYSSPLGRAKQTSLETSKVCNLKVTFKNELREICYGEWDGKKKIDLDQKILAMRKKNLFKFVNPGNYNGISGKSYEQLFNRLKPFFKKLKEETINILVVAHIGVVRCAIKYFEDIDSETFNNLEISNNYIYVVEFRENGLIASSTLLENER